MAIKIYRKPHNCHWKVFADTAEELMELVSDNGLKLLKPVRSIYNREEKDPNYGKGVSFILTDGMNDDEVADAYIGKDPEGIIEEGEVLCKEEVPCQFYPQKDWGVVE